LTETAARGPATPPSFRRRETILVSIATLLALAVRVWFASRSQVWLDEANSVLIALTPLRDLTATLRPDSSPPLYYLVLKVWVFFTSLDPFWLRIPSIVFGAAAIPAVWWVGTRLDRPATGLVAAWLLALHPLHTYYSEEVRMYSMLVLLGLAFYFAVFHVLKGSGKALPAFLAGAALAYTHYYGLVFVASGLLVGFIALPDRRKKTLLCGLGIVLVFLPWVPIFMAQLSNPHHVAWISPFWESYPRAAGVLRSLQAFLPGGMKYPYVPLQGIRFQWLAVGLGVVPFLALATRKNRRALLSPLLLPWSTLIVTLLVLAIRSHFGEPIYLAGRSDIVVLPLFILAVAMAVGRLGTRASALFVGAWLILSGVELARSAEPLRKAGNVAITQAVDSVGCETVVATGLTYAPILFYQMVRQDGAQVVPFPIDMGQHPGNLNPERYTPDQLIRDARILAQEFPPSPDVCVIVPTSTFSGPLADAYLVSGTQAEEIGVFHPSLTVGSPYLLVTFTRNPGY